MKNNFFFYFKRKITVIVIFLLHVSYMYIASAISTMTEVAHRVSILSSVKAPAEFSNDIKIFIKTFYTRRGRRRKRFFFFFLLISFSASFLLPSPETS